jgi:hypothetical protein
MLADIAEQQRIEKQPFATRVAEYEICQRRGHAHSGVTLSTPDSQIVCRWCGTHYWTVTSLREQNVPGES